ncbi:MAG TPA: hypothetical protein VFZ48_02100 [Candidatus Saccharimonadales bacterium]
MFYEHLNEREDGDFEGVYGSEHEPTVRQAAQLAANENRTFKLYVGVAHGQVVLQVSPEVPVGQLLEQFHKMRLDLGR